MVTLQAKSIFLTQSQVTLFGNLIARHPLQMEDLGNALQ
jgi:hypothetical protein